MIKKYFKPLFFLFALVTFFSFSTNKERQEFSLTIDDCSTYKSFNQLLHNDYNNSILAESTKDIEIETQNLHNSFPQLNSNITVLDLKTISFYSDQSQHTITQKLRLYDVFCSWKHHIFPSYF